MTVDGRRVRGERRRRELIDATLRVVQRAGVAGVSHRAVAAEAGLAPSSATYHFTGIDDLLVAALTAVADSWSAVLRDVVDGDRELADVLAHAARDTLRLRAEYELCLLAARRHELRPIARRWAGELAALVPSDPVTARALVAAVDGLLMAAMLADEPPDATAFDAVLRRIVQH